MVLIFDLDDTLYEERDYLTSGFWAVARRLEAQFGWDRDASYRCMMEVMEEQGRGAVFNRLLERHGKMSEALVRDCVKFYRHHPPEIHLLPAAMELLPKLSGSPLYLVTDGHKIVQDHKMRALGIESRFRKVYLTHRYGIRHAKPSPHCFERIREREGCGWEQMV